MKKWLAVMALALTGMLAMPAYANMQCFETPLNDGIFDDQTGFDKQGEREKGYADAENPAMELMMCAMSIPFSGLDIAKDNCQCIPRVKELCSFKFKNGKIRYKFGDGVDKAWCLAFPLSMWSKY